MYMYYTYHSALYENTLLFKLFYNCDTTLYTICNYFTVYYRHRLYLIACKRLRVFYYKDVRSGPRRIPNVNDPLAGLEELPDSARLLWRPASADNAVPASSSGFEVFATLDGTGHEAHLGDQLVYLVN